MKHNNLFEKHFKSLGKRFCVFIVLTFFISLESGLSAEQTHSPQKRQPASPSVETEEETLTYTPLNIEKKGPERHWPFYDQCQDMEEQPFSLEEDKLRQQPIFAFPANKRIQSLVKLERQLS